MGQKLEWDKRMRELRERDRGQRAKYCNPPGVTSVMLHNSTRIIQDRQEKMQPYTHKALYVYLYTEASASTT